jgi:hypothetical protein
MRPGSSWDQLLDRPIEPMLPQQFAPADLVIGPVIEVDSWLGVGFRH